MPTNESRTMVKVSWEQEYNTPCGCKMLEFVLVNRVGHRVGKVSGDLNQESRSSIIKRVIEACK